jgi:predicted enzyme related to lactoylglutathione lyase
VSGQFVWFSLGAEDPGRAREFYSSLLDWEIAEEGMVAGEERPWAAIGGDGEGTPGWLPYVQVPDVDQATARALELGATVLRDKTRGPAGEYTTIADPTGAALALWQPAGSAS